MTIRRGIARHYPVNMDWETKDIWIVEEAANSMLIHARNTGWLAEWAKTGADEGTKEVCGFLATFAFEVEELMKDFSERIMEHRKGCPNCTRTVEVSL